MSKYREQYENETGETTSQYIDTDEAVDIYCFTDRYVWWLERKHKEAEEKNKTFVGKARDLIMARLDLGIANAKLEAVKDIIYGKGSHQERIEELKALIDE